MAHRQESKSESRPSRRERDERVTTEGRSRVARARDKADEWGAKVRMVLFMIGAGIVAVAAFFGGVFPFLFGGLIHGVAEILAGVSIGLAGLGAWMRARSDEPREKAVWLVIIVLALGGLFFFAVGV